jgi:uncharacterized delta-60 repeat protein
MSNCAVNGYTSALRIAAIAAATVVAVSFGAAAGALGAAGDLDPGFGNGGRLVLDLPNVSDMAIDSSDRVILGLATAQSGPKSEVLRVARLRRDGSLDPTFGSGGVATVSTPPVEGGEEIEIDSHGRIVVGASGAIARFLPTGVVDRTFGDSGVRAVSSVSGLGIRPGDAIVVPQHANNAFRFAAYTSSGDPDASFGNQGIASVPGPPGGHPRDGYAIFPHAVAVTEDGKVIGVGSRKDATSDERTGVAVRISPDGTPDATFGGFAGAPGWTGLQTGPAEHAAVQQDGRVVVVGTQGFSQAMVVGRLLASGARDVSFANAGISRHPLRSDTFFGETVGGSVAVDSSGRILAAGSTGDSEVPNDRGMAVVRLLPNGAADPSFGSGGQVVVDFYGYPHPNLMSGRTMALADDGGIVVGGGFANGPAALMRLDSGDPGPGGGGGVAGVVSTKGIRVHRVVVPKSGGRLRRKGVRVLASCDHDCKIVVDVTVSSAIAIRMRLKSLRFAFGSRRADAGERKWVTAKLTPSAKQAMRAYGAGGRMQVTVRAAGP